MYDAVVIGARCAGSPTAMLLARRGYRTLLVDRATFPRDTICTHYVQPPGVRALERWGLLERLRASGCPPIRKISSISGDVVLSGPPARAGIEATFGPRRVVLDELLLDAAVEAGAEVREGTVLEGLEGDGDRVTGVRLRGRDRVYGERARIVIGADGPDSTVARLVEAPEYRTHPSLTCFYYSYWSGVEMEGVELHGGSHQGAAALPTHDGLAMVAVVVPRERLAEFRRDPEGNALGVLSEVAPRLAEKADGGRREERVYGMSRLPNFFRKPFGEGWALVGDAGYCKDPITAMGISDAFRDAEAVAEAVDRALSGREPPARSLEAYERRRNARSLDLYEWTVRAARLRPVTDEQRAFLEALASDQDAVDRFLEVVAGDRSPKTFFSPDNVRRILGEE